MENIEELKKQYEEEIYRLNSLSKDVQQQYQKAYTDLQNQEKALMEEYQHKMSDLSIGIERLRGAYTALVDLEEGKDPTLVVNGMMKPEQNIENQSNVEEDKLEEKISKEVKEKAHKVVSKAKEKGLITPYKEFAESKLGKETAVKDVKEVVSKIPEPELAEPHKNEGSTLTPDEEKALKEVVKSVQQENTKEPENKVVESNVKPDDVPDYLKDQYGLKD